MKYLLTLITLVSVNANAFVFPEQILVDNQLLCTVFDSNGRYYCDELKPVQGQASNTLILEFDDLVKLNTKLVRN